MTISTDLMEIELRMGVRVAEKRVHKAEEVCHTNASHSSLTTTSYAVLSLMLARSSLPTWRARYGTRAWMPRSSRNELSAALRYASLAPLTASVT